MLTKKEDNLVRDYVTTVEEFAADLNQFACSEHLSSIICVLSY
jgi:hypothetical protein